MMSAASSVSVPRVPRCSGVSCDELATTVLRDAGQPVILTDAMEDSRARRRWTSAFFSSRYGADQVIAVDSSSRARRGWRMRLDTFLACCLSPKPPFVALKGCDLFTVYQPFANHPELLDDIRTPDVLCAWDGDCRRGLDANAALLIGQRGAIESVRRCPLASHTWRVQLWGRTHIIAIPPLSTRSRDGADARAVPQWKAVITPGEVFVVPGGWLWQAVSLDPSCVFTDAAIPRPSHLPPDAIGGAGDASDEDDRVCFLPTNHDVAEVMLRLAGLRDVDLVYDLGCGDGRLLIAAAVRYRTRGVGIDDDPDLVEAARAAARRAGVEPLVRFEVGDLFQADISAATVVLLYLLPGLNRRLRPTLLRELRPGSRVVSHKWDMESWLPECTVHVDGVAVMRWTIPGQGTANIDDKGLADAAI